MSHLFPPQATTHKCTHFINWLFATEYGRLLLRNAFIVKESLARHINSKSLLTTPPRHLYTANLTSVQYPLSVQRQGTVEMANQSYS